MHEECYARRGSRNARGRKPSARDIIGELLRLGPRYVQHLVDQGIEPQPPRHLHGVHPGDLIAWWEELERQAREVVEERVYGDEVRLYRQRETTTILGVAVASYPGPPSEQDPLYVRWRELTVAWAAEHYGERLAGVYEHTDERHGHLHVVFADQGRQVKHSLAGHGAALRALQNGSVKADAKLRLIEANKALQDEYHEAVGRHVGLGRVGPAPSQRRSRSVQLRQRLKAELEQTAGSLNAMQEAMRRAIEAVDERERRAQQAEARAESAETRAQQAEERARAAEARAEVAHAAAKRWRMAMEWTSQQIAEMRSASKEVLDPAAHELLFARFSPTPAKSEPKN
ncbi:hypothetical protein [Caldimonas tepidiphila]|uniref:hypothetical protein n=1 Tax=Caldimonas tepidiphila TaxID=2315841 RepID=UPI00196BA973|nr:hypothetical protein [Caldimonas tepidiphila]